MSTVPAFQNAPIDPASLPALGDEAFHPLEGAHLRLQQAGWVVFALVVVIVVSIIAVATPMPAWVALLIAAVAVAMAVLGIVLEQLAFAQRGWLLRDHDISSRHGLVSRNTTTAPFNRVQHVTVNRGALERVAGIARLSVFTAGAGIADLVIPGLAIETAERLKESVLLRSSESK